MEKATKKFRSSNEIVADLDRLGKNAYKPSLVPLHLIPPGYEHLICLSEEDIKKLDEWREQCPKLLEELHEAAAREFSEKQARLLVA